MRYRLFLAVLLSVAWCLPHTMAEAVTRYVQAGGSGGSSCAAGAIGNPLSTIRAAVSCSGPGDIVYIRQGSYLEALQNWDGSRPVTTFPVGTGWGPGQEVLIASAPGEQATLLRGIEMQRGSVNIAGVTPQYLVFDRLIINGGGNPNLNPEPNYPSQAFFIEAQHIKITNSDLCCSNSPVLQPGRNSFDIQLLNSKLHDAYPSFNPQQWDSCRNPDNSLMNGCILPNYCSYYSAHNSIIDHTEIYNCSSYALQISVNEGGVSNNVFSNNIMHDVCADISRFFQPGQRPFYCTGVTLDHGDHNLYFNNLLYNLGPFTNVAFLDHNTADQIYNNTFADSPTGGMLMFGSTDAIVRNNIIRNTVGAAIAEDAGAVGTTYSNNLCSTAAPGCSSVGNPQLASDYKLTSASTLAINTGFSLPGVVTVDLAGVTRPQGGAWDLGAYEFTTVTIPPALAAQVEFDVQPSNTPSNTTIIPSVTVRVEASDGSLMTTATDAITLSLVSTQVPQESLAVVSTDSAETGWPGANAIDGNTATAWHTQFVGGTPTHPHSIVLSFPSGTVNGLRYTPRLGPDVSGQIIGYNVYVSTDGTTWGTAVATGSFGTQSGGKTYGIIHTTPKVGAFLKLESTSSISSTPYASAAELNVLMASSVVPTGTLTQNAVAGVATFALAVPIAGVGYILKATSGSLNSQLSTPFTITSATTMPPAGTDPTTLLRYIPGR